MDDAGTEIRVVEEDLLARIVFLVASSIALFEGFTGWAVAVRVEVVFEVPADLLGLLGSFLGFHDSLLTKLQRLLHVCGALAVENPAAYSAFSS